MRTKTDKMWRKAMGRMRLKMDETPPAASAVRREVTRILKVLGDLSGAASTQVLAERCSALAELRTVSDKFCDASENLKLWKKALRRTETPSPPARRPPASGKLARPKVPPALCPHPFQSPPSWQIKEIFEERAKSLHELGFRDYPEYLASGLWAGIRQAAMAARKKCPCGGRGDQVHHRNYELDTMRGLSPGSLLAVCRSCHESAELIRPRLSPEQVGRLILGDF